MSMRTFSSYTSALKFLLCVISFVCLCSCTDNDAANVQPDGDYEEVVYNVALVYPMSREKEGKACSRTLEWVLRNGALAQQDLSRRIVINVEEYDEDYVDIDSLASALSRRDDIHAVVGPEFSTDMERMAMFIESSHKLLISPWATSAELARKYAGKNFFWSLVESDITQCEMLISRAMNYGAKKISLITSSDTYGNTFNDWFAFQTHEMGGEVGDVYIYTHDNDNSELESMTRKALTDGCDAIICIPSRVEDAVEMIHQKNAFVGNPPIMLFSDVALNEHLLSLGTQADFVEGVTPYIAPETGFTVAYRAKFNADPMSLEGHLYDAFLILFHAFTALDAHCAETLNDAMRFIFKPRTYSEQYNPVSSWQYESMYRQLHSIRENGTLLALGGATGKLDFNIDIQSSILKTTYAHWMIYSNRFITIDLLTSDGSRRTDGIMPSWNWKVENVQSFNKTQEFTYGPKNDNWALLIATSYGWLNYRHQADVLTFYNMLKDNGYDDDHIVLVMQDDLRFDNNNMYQGKVTDYYGNNLYRDDLKLDYKIKDITPEDIQDILMGNESVRLPHVLKPTKDDNILVFWSGHGNKGVLNWAAKPNDECFTTAKMASLLRNMQDKGCYRKMLWIIEACYSASVAIAAEAEEIPAVMMMTAAAANETSKSDLFRKGIYYTDRFTHILTENLKEQPNITYRDLYYNTVKNSTGSHPTIINPHRFDNLYKANTLEFMQPVTTEQIHAH